MAQKRLADSLSAIRESIETVPMLQLEQNAYGIPDLLCRFTHIGYHLGQITKMREMWDGNISPPI